MLTLRRLVEIDGDRCRIVPAEHDVVTYYANSIEHFFSTRRSAQAQPVAAGSKRSHAARSVVLVHGLARTSRSMARLAQALGQAGYDVHNWDYPSREYGVLPLVDALETYARRVAAASERVDFVTHSMGGLLARGVLSRRSLSNAGRLVMLAPPNRGADLASRASDYAWARGFYGQALEDLRADRAHGVVSRLGAPPGEFGVIAGTRSFHPLQPTSYYSSLVRPAGSHDGTVDVEETRLPGMTDFITVNANHTFIMDDDEAIRQTLAFLEHGHFSRPSA